MSPHAPTSAGPQLDLGRRLAVARALRAPAVAGLTDRIRDVVVLASSSRGGSSMVSETLRASDSLLHMQGEINPFLRMTGLGYPASGDCDRLDAGHLAGLDPMLREILDTELAHDIGSPAAWDDDVRHDERFVADVVARLVMQWPEVPVEPALLQEAVRSVLDELCAGRGAPGTGLPDINHFFLRLFAELHGHGLPVNPWYYDLPRRLLRAEAAEASSAAAPGGFLIEEPPFILPRPWRPSDAHEARTKPLVIKTPSNAYRFGFLRALFPQARFRVIHLTRNPAAAVNGLHDGWLHHGFHAHRMDRPLEIDGYVDGHPDNRWWWKFDLPPGWQEFTRAPLLEVCAFQWRSAHRSVLDEPAGVGVERLTVRFEDLTGGSAGRAACFEQLADWLGIPFDGAFRRAAVEGIGPVVATAEPRAGRWRARADSIKAALGPEDKEVAERLGYTDEAEWI
ncbi:sulfotransferase [[Kitasatospora] papulosa]|uniref:sulfotransferase n=1 Tax=[Kitasatospora] papulosa TaxID=1464011 RepID=UPI0036AE403E